MYDLFYHIEKQNPSLSKHDRIVEGIKEAILSHSLVKGDKIPSVNRFISRLKISRMTVVKALNALKEKEIIVSKDKVGYFVKGIGEVCSPKVFLFLAGFNPYHEILYNSIIEEFEDENITIDLFFHHFNPKTFKTILRENNRQYDLYVISPFEHKTVANEMAKIPDHKLLQINRKPIIEGSAFIYQEFYFQLKIALGVLLEPIRKYDRFTLVFNPDDNQPTDILKAFEEFCVKNELHYQIISQIDQSVGIDKTVFWVLEDRDLIQLIKTADKKHAVCGEEYGIISLNDTPMKEIIKEGVTVISIDYREMGKRIATYICNRELLRMSMKTNVIIRNSI